MRPTGRRRRETTNKSLGEELGIPEGDPAVTFFRFFGWVAACPFRVVAEAIEENEK